MLILINLALAIMSFILALIAYLHHDTLNTIWCLSFMGLNFMACYHHAK